MNTDRIAERVAGLTDQQQAALRYLRSRRPNRQWTTAFKVGINLDTPQQGAVRTLASLVRHGLVERTKQGGVVFYRAVPHNDGLEGEK